MPTKYNLPSPWSEFISEVDQCLSIPIEIHCLGGFVLTVVYAVPRTTADVDYISIVPNSASAEFQNLAGPESKLGEKHRVYFQYAGGVSDIPDDYIERLTPLELGLSKLTLKVLDPYDLVLSKLTRNSPKDREDVKAVAQKLNLSFRTLTARFEGEMKPWLPNLERHELTLKLWREYFAE